MKQLIWVAVFGLSLLSLSQAHAQDSEQALLKAKVNSHTAACENATSHTEGNYKATLITDPNTNWIQGVKVYNLLQGGAKRYELEQTDGTDEDPVFSFSAVFYRRFLTNLVSLSSKHIDKVNPIHLTLSLMHRWNGGLKLDFRKLPLVLKPEGSGYVLYTDLDDSNAFDEMTFDSLCEQSGDSVVERGIGKIILKRRGSVVQTIDVANEL
ncbi:MAG: hypothetical protein H7222_06335 [Methylotenera sp.]|nr:hypothetical protein [Oligoflexia bacterium]